jgi:hypothetical protein
LIHDACFGVKWNTMRWPASRSNASRVAIEASTPDFPFSPQIVGDAAQPRDKADHAFRDMRVEGVADHMPARA